jgi:hypothetical protein
MESLPHDLTSDFADIEQDREVTLDKELKKAQSAAHEEVEDEDEDEQEEEVLEEEEFDEHEARQSEKHAPAKRQRPSTGSQVRAEIHHT